MPNIHFAGPCRRIAQNAHTHDTHTHTQHPHPHPHPHTHTLKQIHLFTHIHTNDKSNARINTKSHTHTHTHKTTQHMYSLQAQKLKRTVEMNKNFDIEAVIMGACTQYKKNCDIII